MNDADKILLARHAIAHVLLQVRQHLHVKDVLGIGTESFDRLTVAEAALSGRELTEVRDAVIPGSSGFPHWTLMEALNELKASQPQINADERGFSQEAME